MKLKCIKMDSKHMTISNVICYVVCIGFICLTQSFFHVVEQYCFCRLSCILDFSFEKVSPNSIFLQAGEHVKLWSGEGLGRWVHERFEKVCRFSISMHIYMSFLEFRVFTSSLFWDFALVAQSCFKILSKSISYP